MSYNYYKTNISGRIGNGGANNFKLRVALKYLSNFWETFEILFINCETDSILPSLMDVS